MQSILNYVFEISVYFIFIDHLNFGPAIFQIPNRALHVGSGYLIGQLKSRPVFPNFYSHACHCYNFSYLYVIIHFMIFCHFHLITFTVLTVSFSELIIILLKFICIYFKKYIFFDLFDIAINNKANTV